MARFRIKSFGDEAVVFDTASGDTHFLAPFTLTLFQLVQNNPGLPAHELEAVLMSEIELPGSTHLSRADPGIARQPAPIGPAGNPMKLFQLSPSELQQRLSGPGVWLRTGPFSLRVQSPIPSVAKGLIDLYGQFETRDSRHAFADFHVELNASSTLRRWLRPQVDFSFDGSLPFKPLPLDQAYPMLEWGTELVRVHARPSVPDYSRCSR